MIEQTEQTEQTNFIQPDEILDPETFDPEMMTFAPVFPEWDLTDIP